MRVVMQHPPKDYIGKIIGYCAIHLGDCVMDDACNGFFDSPVHVFEIRRWSVLDPANHGWFGLSELSVIVKGDSPLFALPNLVLTLDGSWL